MGKSLKNKIKIGAGMALLVLGSTSLVGGMTYAHKDRKPKPPKLIEEVRQLDLASAFVGVETALS